MKKIKISLSQSSIQKAIKEINQYRNEFSNKVSLFIEKLIEKGIEVIDNNMNNARGDSDPSHDTVVVISHGTTSIKATIEVSGVDLLFIEFGAGIHYNTSVGTSPNPKGEELGYVIGSYGKGNGAKDKWSYLDENESVHWSYGTEASMPVFKASQELSNVQTILQIAKEVFGN